MKTFKAILFYFTICLGVVAFCTPLSAKIIPLTGVKNDQFYECRPFYDCSQTSERYKEKVLTFRSNPNMAYVNVLNVVKAMPKTTMLIVRDGYFLAERSTYIGKYFIEGKVDIHRRRIYLKSTATRFSPGLWISKQNIRYIRDGFQKSLVSHLKKKHTPKEETESN